MTSEEIFEAYLKQRTAANVLSMDSFALAFCAHNEALQAAREIMLADRAGELGKSMDEFNEARDKAVELRRAGRLKTPPDGGLAPAGEQLPKFFDKSKFLHNVMGDYLIAKYGACRINNAIHIYDDGVYIPGEDILHGHMLELVPTLKDTQRREVYKYIKVSLKTPTKRVSPPHLIPFATRIYDISSGTFLDYGPDFVFLNRFPYDYIPDAPEQPRIAQVINDITCGDGEVQSLLYEAIGNCFYLLNSYRGAVMLYGPSGNNGKSTLLNMITQLLGPQNASYLSLQDMAQKFRLADVYGKAANIGDDIAETYIPDTSSFKRLVTGEQIVAERKGKDPFTFQSYAKLFFAMNALPPVSDKSKAFFSRILLIPMNRDFSKEPGRDVSLKSRTWSREEMEYLTRLAVEGLKRLRKQGDFTRPDCVKEALSLYAMENNPIAAFLAEYGDVDGKAIPPVYDAFCRWCTGAGHRNIPTRTKFTREVCTMTGLSSASIRHPFYNGKTGRCFVTL